MNDSDTWWSGVPTSLHNKINGRQKSLPTVSFVRLADQGAWFVRFDDGSFSWMNMPDDLDAVLSASKNGIEELQIAYDRSAWFVLDEDGDREYSSSKLRELEDFAKDQDDK